ncbi:hypothetical protein ACFL6S_24285 [Candidatus Poribacteria bacterium]
MLIPLLILMSFYGFSPAITTSGDVTLSIADVEPITELEQESPVAVTITSNGDEILGGKIILSVIDKWRVVGADSQAFTISPGEKQEILFKCVAGLGTYAAYYPIHATATVATPSGEQEIHTVLVVEVTQDAVRESISQDGSAHILKLNSPGRIDLTSLKKAQVSFRPREEQITTQPVGWNGTDQTTGTTVTRYDIDRGGSRASIAVHPPWRTGWGTVWLDYSVQLPDAKPILLDFATAIRDHVQGQEPPSDGVQFQVWAAPLGTSDFEVLFDRFSDSKSWEEAQIDLSGYAGKNISLRLLTHPGPEHDTTCDQAYWADPVVLAGVKPHIPKMEQKHQEQVKLSIDMARQALRGEAQKFSWKLADDIGVAVVPGQLGIVDGVIAIATPEGELTYDGFRVHIDGRRIDHWRSGFSYSDLMVRGDTWVLPMRDGNEEFDLAVRVWREDDGLRFGFSLEQVEQDLAGHPRLTHISLGQVDQKLYRLYAGHGNVLQNPGKLRLGYGGFSLSTSFAGFGFANGISLVQGTDIPPDAVSVDPERGIATLEAHHDLTFTIVASTEGAFDAARKYRELIDPPSGRGVAKLLGKMCLDQWGGDYARAAEGLERAARYGLTDSVFVKHVWQRWGYDYRLPDIYPPAGNRDDFQKMVDACSGNGILFAPHDNYIDFYPDATGFSYKHIIFNTNGTPQRAWYNKGRQAQSYRWLPHAFRPWMEKNLQWIKDGIAPTSYFIDVFSAIGPMDYYDESGRFYPKTISMKEWSEAFDSVYEIFDGAPTISEAGHDALVGHLDAAQADHSGWTPERSSWSWNVPAEDGERVPWHDMVTHGRFILLAGGLGSRYAGEGSREMHGYGSDDYLSMTILGGRSPMCDGPFNRSAVMTYWLLHDICADLAQQEMVKHEFSGGDIHRQMVQFDGGGHVIVNRGKSDWSVDGHILPQYGFVAKSAECQAMIIKRDGIITAWSESPDAIFVDARPSEHFGGIPVRVEILGVEYLGGGRFAIDSRWTVSSPIKEPGRTFIHFTNPEVSPEGEHIAFQSDFPIGPEQWQKTGVYSIRAEAKLPDDMPPNEYGIGFGIYQPEQGGGRLVIPGWRDATGRSVGGTILFNTEAENIISVEHKSPPPDESLGRFNVTGKIADFGAIRTNGAFRLLRDRHLVIPLPGSRAFDVTIDLVALEMPGRLDRVEALNEKLEKQEIPAFTIDESLLRFRTKPGIFAYRIVLR